MNFKDFYKKFTNEAYGSSLNTAGTESVEERIVAVWMLHQTIETNKKLVRATWILAIATIILSGLTIYLQYFR